MTLADPSPEYWREYGPFQAVKHRLIKHYLDGWLPKLGSWAGRVLYVETHAGRGRHSSGEAGSPLVALDTLLRHSYRNELLKTSEVRFFFIEQDPENLDHLDAEVRGFGDLPKRVHVELSNGDAYKILSDALEYLRQNRKSMAPAFVFFDPYGFKVPGDLLAQLMTAGRVELFVNVIWRELDMAMRQHQPPEHGLARTLDDLFQGDSWRAVDGDTADERMDRVLQLLSDEIGAKWHTYIRMNSGRRATRYLLLGAALLRRRRTGASGASGSGTRKRCLNPSKAWGEGARRMLTGSTTRSAHRWACGRADAPRFVGVPARIKIATGLQRKLLNRPAPTRCQRTLFNCIRITNHADASGGGRTHASPIPASASWTMMCSTTP